ncbi:hypothetical protein [Halobacteriaceae bacterium SHR40]|uniref:hypothetical protein n=1 Tax=Halovenus amylolytica TaxID=2500550 RepID=UPI000FE2B650
MERRTFLLSVAAGGIVGLAGCSGDGEEDDSADGGSTDDDGSADDGSADGGSTDDDTGGASDDGDDGTGQESPTLGEVFQWEESFIAEMTLEGQTVGEVTIRSNGGNYRQTLETEEGTFEIYSVDGDTYLVQQGSCILNPGGQVPEPDDSIDPRDEEAVTSGQDDISPAGRGTIDGEEMYVYEYTSEGQTVTLSVSVQTGHLRRVEFDQGTIDYHSWGEVDPIEPPDMQCQDISGSGS